MTRMYVGAWGLDRRNRTTLSQFVQATRNRAWSRCGKLSSMWRLSYSWSRSQLEQDRLHRSDMSTSSQPLEASQVRKPTAVPHIRGHAASAHKSQANPGCSYFKQSAILLQVKRAPRHINEPRISLHCCSSAPHPDSSFWRGFNRVRSNPIVQAAWSIWRGGKYCDLYRLHQSPRILVICQGPCYIVRR
jgi:hypothetical protein